MNSTLTSSNTLARLPLQRTQFLVTFDSPGSTTPLDRGGFSGDLTDFSSTNVALRAVEGTEEANEFHVDLTQHFGKTPVTTNAVLYRI